MKQNRQVTTQLLYMLKADWSNATTLHYKSQNTKGIWLQKSPSDN